MVMSDFVYLLPFSNNCPPPFAKAGDIKSHSSLCLSVCPSVCLSVCLSVRLSQKTLTLFISSEVLTL